MSITSNTIETEELSDKLECIYHILNANSIAVVGASKNPNKWGYNILKNMICAGYKGKIYPINPREKIIQGLKVYKSILDVPGELDLMIIAVPPKFIPAIIKEGIQKKVAGVAIVTSGYREVGNIEREMELKKLIEGTKLHILGPNIQGLGTPSINLCAQPSPLITKKGPIAVISQSGSITSTITQWAQDENIGISGFVNLGNQIDLCESDFLRYFGEHIETKVISLYIEGAKNGKHFFNALREVCQKKPVVVLKPGRTTRGVETASSHTASIAGSDKVFNGALLQCGAIRAYGITDFYDYTKVFATQPLVEGNRVFIITSSGGVASLLIDYLVEKGVDIPELTPEQSERMQKAISIPGVRIANPCDFPAFQGSDYAPLIKLLAEIDGEEDLTDLFIFNVADSCPGLEHEILKFSKLTSKPIVVNYQGGGEDEKIGAEFLNKNGIPIYPVAERAANSVGALIKYSQFRKSRKILVWGFRGRPSI